MRLLLIILILLGSDLKSQAQLTKLESEIISSALSTEKRSKTCPKIYLKDSTVFPHSHDYFLSHVLQDEIKYDTALSNLFKGDSAISKFIKEHKSFRYTAKKLPSNLKNVTIARKVNKSKLKECGSYSVGRPFVNRGKNIAMVYLAYDCGPMCASGYLIFLKYSAVKKKWIPIAKKRLWIS